jgi:hypothetical protein
MNEDHIQEFDFFRCIPAIMVQLYYYIIQYNKSSGYNAAYQHLLVIYGGKYISHTQYFYYNELSRKVFYFKQA